MRSINRMSGRTNKSAKSRHSVHELYDDLPVSEPTELEFGLNQVEPDDELLARAISQIGSESVLNKFEILNDSDVQSTTEDK